MKKQNKRKGFALLEMLGVIAVIAVLTAIAIPIIGDSTIRARAATNAANLRAIESKVAMHMLTNEGVYDEYLENKQTITAASSGTIISKIYNFFAGPNAAENFALRYERVYDGGDGVIPVPPNESITGVPKAQDLEAPNRDGETAMTVSNQYMSVYITYEGAIAFYGDWTKEDFADVAEDGIYDGTTTGNGGSGSGNFLEYAVCVSTKKHAPGPGCVCQTCGSEAHWGADAPAYNTSETKHLCESNHVIQEKHKYVEVDRTYHKCVRCGEEAELLEHNWDWNKCDDCSATKPACGVITCTQLVYADTDYCGSHQLVTCNAEISWLYGGGTCTETIPNGEYLTCNNRYKHATFAKCRYPDCNTTVETDLYAGLCGNHKDYQYCANGHEGVWFTGSCPICKPTIYCNFSGCKNTVEKTGDYCSDHVEKIAARKSCIGRI